MVAHGFCSSWIIRCRRWKPNAIYTHADNLLIVRVSDGGDPGPGPIEIRTARIIILGPLYYNNVSDRVKMYDDEKIAGKTFKNRF